MSAIQSGALGLWLVNKEPSLQILTCSCTINQVASGEIETG